MATSKSEYQRLLAKAQARESQASAVLTWEEAEATPAFTLEPPPISWTQPQPKAPRARRVRAEAPPAAPVVLPPHVTLPPGKPRPEPELELEPEAQLRWNARRPGMGEFPIYSASDADAGEHLGYRVNAPEDATLWEAFL